MKNSKLLSIVVMLCLVAGNSAFSQETHSVFPDPAAPQVLGGTKGGNYTDATVGYFYEFTTDNLYTFPVPAGVPQTIVGNTGNHQFYAADFGPGGVYYAIDYNDNMLYSINPATGAATSLVAVSGLPPGVITGMAYHEGTNTMYLSTVYSSVTTLCTLNVNTGAITVIGPITNASLVIFLAINCAGDLYGVDLVPDVLVKINTSTAAGTVIGPVNYAANYAQGADFDSQTGILYWAAYSGGGLGSLRTIDLQTGNSTEVVPLNMEVDAFVIQSGCSSVPLRWWSFAIIAFLIGSFIVYRFWNRI